MPNHDFAGETEEDIKISIIIPIRSLESDDFKECFHSLQEQNYQLGYEIIFVEGGNIAQARNKGISLAVGDNIAFIDSDCYAPKNWLSLMQTKLRAFEGAGGVGGSGISPPNKGYLADVIDINYQTYIGSLGSPSLSKTNTVKNVRAISTHNSIFSKQTLLEVGGFDERFLMNEDTELCLKIIEKNKNLYYIPESFVYHNRQENLFEYCIKFFSWGMSRTRAVLTNNKLFDFRIFSLLGLLSSSLLIGLKYWFFPVVFFLTYLSLVILHGIYFGFKLGKIRFMFLIPLLYFLQHSSFTLGLFWGFFKGKYVDLGVKPEFKVFRKVLNKPAISKS